MARIELALIEVLNLLSNWTAKQLAEPRRR